MIRNGAPLLVALVLALPAGSAFASPRVAISRHTFGVPRAAGPQAQAQQIPAKSAGSAIPLKPGATRKAEPAPSATPEWNPLKRKRMAMPTWPSDPDVEFAF